MTGVENIAPSSNELPSTSGLPPLRLHHFFAWTAVSAALFALVGIGIRSSPEEVARWRIVAELPGLLGSSLALTCCGFGLSWRRHGLLFPSQPGHGLILLSAAGFAVALVYELPFFVLWAVFWRGRSELPDFALQYFEWESYTHLGASLGLSLWFAWWVRPARRWQVFFVLNGLLLVKYYIDPLLESALIEPISNLEWIGPALALGIRFIMRNVPHLIPGVALIVAVVRDRRDHVPRHWSHWAGIVAWCTVLPGEIVLVFVNIGWLPLPITHS